MKKKMREKKILGWREWCGFPDLGIRAIKAKLDTGARTSSLHAYNIKPVTHDGVQYVEFDIHPVQRKNLPSIPCKAPVIDERHVKSSSGVQQLRYIVEVNLNLNGEAYPIELSLTNRDEMGFRLLLGRHALKRKFIVDPAISYVLGTRN